LRLSGMEAVEKHFRETHKENIIKPVESHRLSGVAARALRSPELSRLLRSVWEDQRRFPLQIATVLSQQFASHGLQFFKVNKTVTHVAVARPHYLDLEATPVSAGVKSIVDFINAHPRTNRRKLVEALSPSPPAPPVIAISPAEGQAAPVEGATPPVAPEPGPTPEQSAVILDLHWLIHQGHVIEFANGTLDTAKKPLPKPPRPEPKAPVQPTGASQPAGPLAAEETKEAEPVAEPPPISVPTADSIAEVPMEEAPPVLETPGDATDGATSATPVSRSETLAEQPAPQTPA